jgi:hypothetical protein
MLVSNRYLQMTIADDSQIRSQDSRSVMSSVYSNPFGIDLAFDFLLENYEALKQQ